MNNKDRLKEIIGVIKKYYKDINPINVRLAIEELGPTFIKMGQILSSREDLIPREYCEELKKLRSKVAPMPYEQVENILIRELKCPIEDVFKMIETVPIGSASIAEVYKGILKNGDTVAVKIERENIKQLMKTDSDLLKRAISILHINALSGNIIDFTSVIEEMYETAKQEMNFFIEQSHIEEFKKYNQDVNYIKPLKVYEEYTTENLLIMEYVEGFSITDKNSLIKEGYDMDEIGSKLADNYVKQAIDDGFYHADPHPDNIKIVDGKITYLDFGMIGRLSSKNRELLSKCIIAIVKDDISEVAHILTLLDISGNTIDYMELKSGIRKVLDKDKSTAISNIDIKEFSYDVFKLLNKSGIKLPNEITLLIRGIVVIEGVLEEISPNISLLKVFKSRLDYKNIISKDQVAKLAKETLQSGTNLVQIPNELLTTLKGVNNGELRFNIELTDSKHQIDRIEQITHQVIITVLDVAFIIGTSSIVVNSEEHLPFIFYVYMLGAIICTSWLIYKMIISKFKRY